METNKVEGRDVGDVLLYALSTCVWCRKTKRLLNRLGIAYRYIDADLVKGEERERLNEEIEKWNPARSFPTLVINDERCIRGYKEKEIKELVNEQ